ncbi:MAG: hypothetical protein JJW01_00170 [Alphaproteobacteria bacterium]|nr:hypothetical protein [Rickettsiales bacterium]
MTISSFIDDNDAFCLTALISESLHPSAKPILSISLSFLSLASLISLTAVSNLFFNFEIRLSNTIHSSGNKSISVLKSLSFLGILKSSLDELTIRLSSK